MSGRNLVIALVAVAVAACFVTCDGDAPVEARPSGGGCGAPRESLADFEQRWPSWLTTEALGLADRVSY